MRSVPCRNTGTPRGCCSFFGRQHGPVAADDTDSGACWRWRQPLLLRGQRAGTITAAEPQWIWSPAYEKEQAPAGECYFRKSFHLGSPEHGEIQIGCDDRYELYVNGRLVGSGKNWKVLDVYDITSDLVSGTNVIAVKATNDEQGSAGLAARVAVKQEGGTHVTHSSDATWKTSLREFVGWQKAQFNDSQWLAAREFGPSAPRFPGATKSPWPARRNGSSVLPEFHVESVIDPKETGSLVAMTFDEFGQIIAARENGPLILVRDEDRNGLLDTVSTFSDEVKELPGLALGQRQDLCHRRRTARERPSIAWPTPTATAKPIRSNRCSSSPARWASTGRTRWRSVPTD